MEPDNFNYDNSASCSLSPESPMMLPKLKNKKWLPDGTRELSEACKSGNLEQINEILINARIDLSNLKHSRFNPIFVAFKHKQLSTLRFLMDRGAVIDLTSGLKPILKLAKENPDNTMLGVILERVAHSGFKKNLALAESLEMAVERQMSDIVTLFIAKGAYPLKQENINYKIFCYMIERNYIQCVAKMASSPTSHMEFSSNLIADSNLLEIAVKLNRFEIVHILLTRGARVDSGTMRPLITAITLGHNRIASLLINNKADTKTVVNWPSPSSRPMTPMGIACRIGNMVAVRLLVEVAHLDVNKACEPMNQLTPLHVACDYFKCHGNLELIKYLIRIADINARDVHNHTALFYSICDNNWSLTDLLLRTGAAINTQNLEGWTPLHSAAINHSPSCMKVLLRYNGNLNIRDKLYRSPIHYAVTESASRVNLDVLNMLLNRHTMIDINRYLDDEGNNLLRYLIVRKFEGHGICETLNALLHYGGDMSSQFVHFPICGSNTSESPVDFCKKITFYDKVFLLGYRPDSFTSSLLDTYNYKRDDQAALYLYGNELRQMRSLLFENNPNISLYDLLVANKDRAAAYTAYSRLINYFEGTGRDLVAVFPHYGLLLNSKIRKGSCRRLLKEAGRQKLSALIGVKLPGSLTEIIFRDFNQRDLELLIQHS